MFSSGEALSSGGAFCVSKSSRVESPTCGEFNRLKAMQKAGGISARSRLNVNEVLVRLHMPHQL